MVDPEFQSSKVLDKQVEFFCSFRENTNWTFSGILMPSNVEIRRIPNTYESYIKISNIRTKNNGTYKCLSDEEDVLYYDYGVLEVQGKG